MNDTSFTPINKDQNNDHADDQSKIDALNERLDAYGAEPKFKARKKRDPNKPKIPKKITSRYLHNSGLAYLQRFATSSGHFKTVMMRKIDKSCRHHLEQDREACEKMLDELIPKFQDLGLLDDEAYIKGVVTSARRRGLSSMKIKQKLMQKNVSTDEITQAIQTHDHDEYEVYESTANGDFIAALTFIRRKKFGAFDVENKKDYQKSLASMARAGFQYGVSEKILNMSLEEIERDYSFIL